MSNRPVLLTRRTLLKAGLGTAFAAACMPLAGCGALGGGSSNKTKVRIALNQAAMTEGMPAALRAKFPDVTFQFTMANNSADYYAYLAEHDDLPDIITVRRFSLRDSLKLNDHLVDVSSTDLAATYYQNYLANYTYEDGSVNWLPAAAEIWCIVANKTLFEESGIALPTDYPSFIAACEAFKAKGIQGYVSDWAYDYTALETLEGFNIDTLQSIEGQTWRTAYESGTEDGLDASVWKPAFERMADMLTKTANTDAITPGTSLKEFDDVQAAMDGRQVAMIRSSGAELQGYNERNTDEFIILPYFGDTPEQNWILTYPYFQAAMNKNSEVDSDLLMDIFTYMLGQDVQDSLGMKTNVVSYTNAVTVEMDESLDEIKTYVDQNRIYTRLANNEFFAASLTAVTGLIDGSMDAEAAYNAMNDELSQPKEAPEMDMNNKVGYKYEFDPSKGNPACSAILNSLREVWGTDVAVSYPLVLSNSIYEGEASSSQLKYYLGGAWGNDFNVELSGADFKALVAAMVHYEGENNRMGYMPVSDDMLPVASGFEMQVKATDEGYELTGLTKDGAEFDESATYNVAFNIPISYVPTIAEDNAGLTIPEGANKILLDPLKSLTAYFDGDYTKQFAEPTDYIKLS